MTVEMTRPHRWDLAPYEAQKLQEDLAGAVRCEDDFPKPQTMAGLEVAHSRFSDQIGVAVALVRVADMALIETQTMVYRTSFPFVAELTSFRELPAALAVLELLGQTPDLVMVGGPGIAHTKGLGIASHLGVVTDLPTIGCAKSTSVGSFVEPEVNAGSTTNLVWKGEIIGTVFRSKNRVAPLFVSAGHRVSRTSAARMVQESCHGYRLPEPLRHASHALATIKLHRF